MAYSGKFTPRNPQKYHGDPTNIIYRSSWECRVMDRFDRDPNILTWASEELTIPYVSPADGKVHRYFPDFLVKYKTQNNQIKVMMVEIKPKNQTREPVQPTRKTRKFINEVITYGINQAKWKAATEYCLDRGWDFKVLTEDDLGIK